MAFELSIEEVVVDMECSGGFSYWCDECEQWIECEFFDLEEEGYDAEEVDLDSWNDDDEEYEYFWVVGS